ncbi:MAG TPA: hypothetical protein VN702_00585 [Acetobacteraceae bacterium]|nr:hypothetical protein [Acetobacteraceae bacterium]
MSPSEQIIAVASEARTITDANGRSLSIRKLRALDTLRLFKAAGPVLAENEPWMSMASLAMSVTEIEGVPVPSPSSERQIEGIIERLGDAGVNAIADATLAGSWKEDNTVDPSLGNSPGTLP